MTEVKPRSIGTFFKPVVIDPRLRDLVNKILLASSASDSAILVAKKRIRAMTTPSNSYLFATEIQKYLEAKTAGGTESWVYALVGDLFLDSFESNLFSLGPNFFQDHYSNVMWSLRRAESPDKTAQGAFYCIDLVLRKTIDVYLKREGTSKIDKGVLLSFQKDEELDYHSINRLYLDLGRQCLQDAIEAAIRVDRSSTPAAFIDYLVVCKKRLENALNRWEALHKRPGLLELTDEQYLEAASATADEIDHAPLAAAIKEYQVLLREKKGLLTDTKTELEQSVHPLFGAASMYLSQGNAERDVGAFELALRRYRSAEALFTKIQDRTSTAKVHVERARLFIKSGEDPDAIRDGLHDATCLIMAHMGNLRRGAVPEIKHEAAIEFLKNKGYVVEAEAYAAAIGA